MSKLITISSSDLSHVLGGIDGGQVWNDAMDGAETGAKVGTIAGGALGAAVVGRRGIAPGGELGAVLGTGVGAVVGAGSSVYHQATGK